MFEGVLINYGSWMLPSNQHHINLKENFAWILKKMWFNSCNGVK